MEQQISIGLISEGVTDHAIIENILTGFFNNNDLDIRALQPTRDYATGAQTSHANWTKVFDWCKSERMAEALNFIDYIVIQIDTDVSEDKGFDVPKNIDGKTRDAGAMVLATQQKLQWVMGTMFDKYKDKIIFAIAVESIECWVLPLLYSTKPHQQATVNCLQRVNQILIKDGYTIDTKAKNYNNIYDKISKDYQKQKLLKQFYPLNPSLKIFVENLKSTFINNTF